MLSQALQGYSVNSSVLHVSKQRRVQMHTGMLLFSRSNVLMVLRCRHTCMSCSALMVEGNCSGSLNLKCDDCFFTFKSKVSLIKFYHLF